MMRVFNASWIVLCLFSGMAAAQGTIRTGEHGEYTRVVIPIGADRDYVLEGEGPSRSVVLDPPGTFRTARVLSTLYTDRITRIESDADGNVQLDLGCNCDILAYRYESSYLVIDIYDPAEGPDPADGPEEDGAQDLATAPDIDQEPPVAPVLPEDAPTLERALADQRPYRPAAALARDLLQVSFAPVPRLAQLDATRGMPPPANAPDAADDDGMERTGQSTAAETTPPHMDDRMQMSGADEPAQDMMMSDEPEMTDAMDMAMPGDFGEPNGLDDTAEALARQLARAAAAGLLDTSAQQPFTAADQPEPPREEAPEVEDVAEGDPEAAGLPVRAANAFDVAGNRDGGLAAIAAALSCAQPIGDMASWSEGLGFDQQLGALRQAAFDSDGGLIRGPTIDLARYYIYHGFGAEAEAWLLQLEEPPQTELAMARFLDDRPGPNFPEVETLALCSGLDILWRFVDAPDFPELALSQRQEMRLAFSGLPTGLRRLLGPDFVRRLAAAGYDDDATDVREALSRGPMLDEAEALVLEMETTDDRPTRSETEALDDRLQTAGPDTARVMREYLAARRQASDPPEESRLIAAEALLRERAPDRTEGSLWHEVLLAHTSMGDMERTFSMLDASSEAPQETYAAITQSVVDILLSNGQDAAMIVMATRLTAGDGVGNLPADMRNEMYDRLMYFGLSDLAAPFSPGSTMRGSEDGMAEDAQELDGPAAQVAQRLEALNADGTPSDPGSPDEIRATLDDSRSLREELSALLGSGADN